MNTKTSILTIVVALFILVTIFGFVDGAFAAVWYGCISHNDVRCTGNGVYWFDSCGNQQELAQACPYGCQNNRCANQVIYTNYTKHYVKSCNNNNVYWYDSNSTINDLYKNCNDNNELTTDTCSKGKCVNELKDVVTPTDCPAQTVCPIAGLNTSTFCNVEGASTNWSKNISISAGEQINCLMIVKNLSNDPANDVTVRADIPTEINTISDVKIDGIASTGNITSGINLGNFSPNSSKIITFSGKAQSPITEASGKQITGMATSGSISGSDSLVVNFKATIAGASTASLEKSSPFVDFLKRWYLWILIAIVLVFLFIVIFRRLSTNI